MLAFYLMGGSIVIYGGRELLLGYESLRLVNINKIMTSPAKPTTFVPPLVEQSSPLQMLPPV